MDLFELSATLGLDTKPFTSALGDVKNMAMKALGEIADLAIDFGKDVLKTGMGFDKEMSAVRAVLGETEGTLENMNRLREFALEQSRDSVFTAEEAAEAYYYMGMAGWKTEQMIAGLPAILALAAASGEDLGKTSDIVTDALTAFGLGAGQATDFADVLAQTATNANTDVARMGQTFKYVASVAGSLSYSYKDVALSIALAANAGIKGSQAGTSLRNVWTRLATDAGATDKKLGALGILQRNLGVQFYDAAGKARPWVDVLIDSREAWRKLDTSKAGEVTKAFGMVASEGVDAAQVVEDFTNDLDTWTSEWNLLTTKAERESFAAQYEDQFKALGVSMRDSRGELREFNDVASEARIKLGGLGDKRKTTFANTISSLRAMTTWLAMMNANEEDFRKLVDDIWNAEGAAQRMADIRRDDLWGDISRFLSEYDHIKNRLYDSTKGPLRELVQAATSSLKEVTDTYMSDGWGAAVDKAFSSLTMLWEQYAKPITDKLGPAIGNALIKGLDWFNLEGGKIISDIAATFAGGLWDGIVNKVKEEGTSHGGLLDTLTFGLAGQIFGPGDSPGDEYELGDVNGALGYVKKKTGGNSSGGGAGRSTSIQDLLGWNDTGTGTVEGSTININDVEVDASMIQSAIDAATESGSPFVTIAGLEMDQSYAEELLAELSSDLSGTDTSGLESAIGTAGSVGGAQAADNVQAALGSRSYYIDVIPKILGFIGGLTGWTPETHGKSMSGGTILQGSTVFGMNSNGQPMVGGEAGPEAVVGMGSLDRMIQSSVNGAMNGVLSRLDTMVNRVVSYSPKFYLDTGALVGGTVNGMNSELNNVALWKGYGRA